MAQKKLAKKLQRRSLFKTASGLEVAEIYGSEASESPGEYPFTRGIRSNMYRGRLWTMRQYAGFGSAREANQRYHFLLNQGTTGLSVAFDLPTQMGRDSDHPLAGGEVGKVGVAISSLEDMRILFDKIPLDKVSTSMTINSTAATLLALYIAVAGERGIDLTALRGTVQNDILKEYIARGTYIYPPEPALRIVTDIMEFCSSEVPNWNTISVSGYHIREAGSTAVEEVAFTLANGIAYVDSAIKRGLAVDEFAPRIAFFFNCHNDFLEEVAKFRAARRMWAKIMRLRFKAKLEASCLLRFHTQTAGSSLTAQQPLNNVVRTSLQALAAVLGGTQSLHTNSYDEALGLPTRQSALLALRTQQIIAEESGVASSVDPLGGSYLIEEWTDRIEAEATALIELIDDSGGMVAAIERGFPQERIESSAYDYQKGVENGDLKIVGVNEYQEDCSEATEILKLDPRGEREQCERLASLRASRDSAAHTAALSALKKAATDGCNLMPPIIAAVRALATLGEISACLREEFGEHHS